MARNKAVVSEHSYGIYDGWDRSSKTLPNLVKITDQIPVGLDVEFGYILRIQHARNSKITFRIEHPDFLDSRGDPAPAFEGEMYVKNNDFRFFLGDTFWEPLDDKRGVWRLITWLDGKQVADRTFIMN